MDVGGAQPGPPPAQASQDAIQRPHEKDGSNRGSGGSGGRPANEANRRKSSEVVRRFLRRVNQNPSGVGMSRLLFRPLEPVLSPRDGALLTSQNFGVNSAGFGLAAFAFVSLLCCVFKFGGKDASESYGKEVRQLAVRADCRQPRRPAQQPERNLVTSGMQNACPVKAASPGPDCAPLAFPIPGRYDFVAEELARGVPHSGVQGVR